jgi:hypothetical protein
VNITAYLREKYKQICQNANIIKMYFITALAIEMYSIFEFFRLCVSELISSGI